MLLGVGDGAVGSLNHVGEQCSLDERHAVAALGGVGPLQVPVDVLHFPQFVDLLVGEILEQVDAVEGVVVLEAASNFKHVVHKLLSGLWFCLHEEILVEKLMQEARGVDACVHDAVADATNGLALWVGKGVLAVAPACVVHVVVAGIGEDACLGVEGANLRCLVAHRQDAANPHRGAGVDAGVALEHLGEVLAHALCDALVLLGSHVAQFARAALCLESHLLQDAQQHLAFLGEVVELLELLKRGDGSLVTALLGEPAAAVAAVVVDEKRLIACWCRCELRQPLGGVGVGIVVAAAAVVVDSNLLLCYLGLSHCRYRGGTHNNINKKPAHDVGGVSNMISFSCLLLST